MPETVKTIGIIGAGKVGIVLAQLAIKAGYTVYIAGSSDPKKIALTISALVPGARAVSSIEAAEMADCIIAAIPLGKYKNLPREALKGKLVIDAMNYWWEVDGDRPDLTHLKTSSSEIVQEYLSESRVVKAFNHIGYHDLHDENRPEGAHDRKAIAIAGNNQDDLNNVAMVVNMFGFDPVLIGGLSEGIKLQPGSTIFGAHVDAEELKNQVKHFYESEFGKEILKARNSII